MAHVHCEVGITDKGHVYTGYLVLLIGYPSMHYGIVATRSSDHILTQWRGTRRGQGGWREALVT